MATHTATATHEAKGTWKELSLSFDEATARLPEALQKEGFGIITQIDLQQTFKAKLGIDFRRYRIFGACNPSFAHTAVLEDPRIGVLLPCNIVIYETDEGRAVIGAVDPMQTLGSSSSSTDRGGLGEVAAEVGQRLARVLASY